MDPRGRAAPSNAAGCDCRGRLPGVYRSADLYELQKNLRYEGRNAEGRYDIPDDGAQVFTPPAKGDAVRLRCPRLRLATCGGVRRRPAAQRVLYESVIMMNEGEERLPQAAAKTPSGLRCHAQLPVMLPESQQVILRMFDFLGARGNIAIACTTRLML